MKVLHKCKNFFGFPIGKEYTEKLKKYINNINPTPEEWDGISGIIIDSSPLTTIWNAVIELDPTFPKRGRIYNDNFKVVKEWEKIPPGFTVGRAIDEHFRKKFKEI